MLAAGVLRRSDRDSSLYDYFRDRVMFPIENRQGKIIAFGARALDDVKPKYLNSAEGTTFSKKGGALRLGAGTRRDAAWFTARGR